MSKRLCELGRLEGPHRSFVDCWKDTYTGLYESELEEPERSRSLNASKKLISRLAKNESVLKSFEEELQEVVNARDHEEQGDITESSSTGSRAERAAANRERRWWDLTTQVYNGELSPKSCQSQLRNKYGMKVQLAHVKEAVSRLKRHVQHMKWAECTETRGRATLLTNEQELSLVKDIDCMLEHRCWFHWTLICRWAEDMYVADNANEESSASQRFGYHWYTCFLTRHHMKVTRLQFRDTKRTNSATPASIAHYYDELYQFLEEVGFAEKNDEHDPELPFSPVLKWLPGMKRRVVLGDETSVDMKMDGTRCFTYVSRMHAPRSRIDAPTPQFRCSVMGSRNAMGDCFAPMFVTQRDFKWKDEITARGTVLVDGAPQTPHFAHNEKGSFNETNFINFLQNILAPAYPDLSPENPIVFIVDGVKTHATPTVVKTAHAMGIRLFLLPPNCTHLLQGEDLVNFPVFKKLFNTAKLEHLTKMTYSAFILNQRAKDTHQFANTKDLPLYFAQTFSPAWTKGFSKELNLVGLEVQGILKLDRYALWKNFPQWQQEPTTASESSVDSAEPRTPASVSSSRGTITSRVERGAHIFDRTDDERAIDGSNDEVGRLVPFLDRLAQVKEHCYHENDVISKKEFDIILACAVNTTTCIVLKDRKHRQRGRAPRGELTLEDADERAKRQKKAEPSAERIKQQEATQNRRAGLYATLCSKLNASDFLAKPLTLNEMVDVIHHLKRINLFGGSVPQGPKRHQLEDILRHSWPELVAFNEQSKLRVEVGSQGDRRTTGRVARKDTAAVARACESPPLGCASCRGRLEGCKRCIKWRDEGRIPSTTSKSGFQVWTAPE